MRLRSNLSRERRAGSCGPAGRGRAALVVVATVIAIVEAIVVAVFAIVEAEGTSASESAVAFRFWFAFAFAFAGPRDGSQSLVMEIFSPIFSIVCCPEGRRGEKEEENE